MAATTQQDKRASSVVDTAKDVAGRVGEAAQGAMESASHMASDAASYVGKKASSAASAVGNTIESGGKYLQSHSLSEMGGDMTQLIRNNPIPALLIALGVGFLFARAIRG